MGIFFRSRRWQECSLVRQPMGIFVSRTYDVGQFQSNRGHRRHEETGARVTGVLLP